MTVSRLIQILEHFGDHPVLIAHPQGQTVKLCYVQQVSAEGAQPVLWIGPPSEDF